MKVTVEKPDGSKPLVFHNIYEAEVNEDGKSFSVWRKDGKPMTAEDTNKVIDFLRAEI